MAIILNVGIDLIRSGSKVTTYILISAHCLNTCAHCLLNTCKVLELSHQVCRHRHNEKEVVETWAKEEAKQLEKQETMRSGGRVG